VQARNCAYCGHPVKWVAIRLIWLATDYADLDGYCSESPEHEHLPDVPAAELLGDVFPAATGEVAALVSVTESQAWRP